MCAQERPYLLGVDYYPEHWPFEMLETDLADIRKTGSNTIRIGEFAWHKMEPQPGHFDFSFFDHVIQKATEAGLKVLFGTPTATFPAWLADQHPDVLSQDQNGHPRAFGGRREYCFNSETYLKYSLRIVEKLVAHYGNHPNVIGWQADNEWGHEGSDTCWCPACHRGFQAWLQGKYPTIDALNEAWGTIFWGQTYNLFTEIPVPKPTITTHNPALLLDWARFRSDSLVNFARRHIETIRQHKGEHQQVTHNLFGGYFDRMCDQNDLAELLDVVSYDNYPVWGGLEKPISPARSALALDYIRGLKGQNYWILEQLMGAQGHSVIGYLPRPMQAVLWSHQAMAHGAESLLYFRWRGMTRGAEQFCLGLIDQDNGKGRKVQEAQGFFETVEGLKSLYQGPIQPSIAAVYDYDNIQAWKIQPQSASFDFETEFVRLYEPFFKLNVPMDVIAASKDFSQYKVLLIPAMMILDAAFARRLEAFTQQGGIVVFSYRTGLKDRNGNLHFCQMAPCEVSKLCGIQVPEAESLGMEGSAPVQSVEGRSSLRGTVKVWRDLIFPVTAETLYTYSDEPYQQYAAITRNNWGNGYAYVVGCGADEAILQDIAEEVLVKAGIEGVQTPEGLELIRRVDIDGNQKLILMNHNGHSVSWAGHLLKPYETQII